MYQLIQQEQCNKISGYQFYNTSKFDLAELCNDPDNIATA